MSGLPQVKLRNFSGLLTKVFLTFFEIFLTFYQNFPDFSKSNFYFKLILKYIIKYLKPNIKLSILFHYRLKQHFFFAELNNLTSTTSLEPFVYDIKIDVFAKNSSISKILVFFNLQHNLYEKRNKGQLSKILIENFCSFIKDILLILTLKAFKIKQFFKTLGKFCYFSLTLENF